MKRILLAGVAVAALFAAGHAHADTDSQLTYLAKQTHCFFGKPGDWGLSPSERICTYTVLENSGQIEALASLAQNGDDHAAASVGQVFIMRPGKENAQTAFFWYEIGRQIFKIKYGKTQVYSKNQALLAGNMTPVEIKAFEDAASNWMDTNYFGPRAENTPATSGNNLVSGLQKPKGDDKPYMGGEAGVMAGKR
jgi:hypothetical protein